VMLSLVVVVLPHGEIKVFSGEKPGKTFVLPYFPCLGEDSKMTMGENERI
jgi:hypothetical protein